MQPSSSRASCTVPASSASSASVAAPFLTALSFASFALAAIPAEFSANALISAADALGLFAK